MRSPSASGAGGLPRRALLALAMAAAGLALFAQSAGAFMARPLFSTYFPLDTYSNDATGTSGALYSTGYGGGMGLDWAVLDWLSPLAQANYAYLPFSGSSEALSGPELDLGASLALRPFDRLGLRLEAMGGLASLGYGADESGMAFAARARLGLEYRLLPALSVTLSGGYATYFGTQAQIASSVEAGLGLSYDLQALGGTKPKVRVAEPKLDAVFPSLYAYYDDNPFGSVKVVNGEDSGITDVKVSFNAGHYMDQPKLCGSYARIAKGASQTVPVTALFTDSVLQITQGTDAKGEIIVEYNLLGSPRTMRAPIDFRMHHRNAITWSDDRRAAAFASVTNPAALWFSKFAAGVVRDRMRGDINKPLQYAIGMFEAERLYGLNYVVVPANDYSVKHGIKDYVDSVQFPHQTLSNRGGDCSDLAVLFVALMQSVGVESAFITIPGHIYAAFDTGLDPATAQSTFYDPGLLIYRDGKAWLPVEVTMVKDGFIKAWRVAAKEWYDSVRKDSAAFYRLPECWKTYPPAAFPGVNPRFNLPSEADEAVAFDGALDRFVARQIKPAVDGLDASLAKESPAVRANELGVLYARYGMLKESWAQFSAAAKDGSQVAWTNLAGVAYLRKDYKLALQYYQWSYRLNPADDAALLGMARCQYELEDFDSSDAAYALLDSRDPGLAGKYGYLASIYGGEGRAWSLAERAASTSWGSALARKAEPASAPAKAAAAPAVSPNAGDAPASAPAKAAAAPAVSPNAADAPTTASAKAAAAPAVSPNAADAPTAASAKAAAVPAVSPNADTLPTAAAVESGRYTNLADQSQATPAIAAEAPADDKKGLASAAELAAQKRQNEVEAQVAEAKAGKSAEPASEPTLAADAPKDKDLASQAAAQAEAQRRAELEAQALAAKRAADEAAARKRQAELEAKVAALAASSSSGAAAEPPKVVADAPKDVDLAEKKAAAAIEKRQRELEQKQAEEAAAAKLKAELAKKAADAAAAARAAADEEKLKAEEAQKEAAAAVAAAKAKEAEAAKQAAAKKADDKAAAERKRQAELAAKAVEEAQARAAAASEAQKAAEEAAAARERQAELAKRANEEAVAAAKVQSEARAAAEAEAPRVAEAAAPVSEEAALSAEAVATENALLAGTPEEESAGPPAARSAAVAAQEGAASSSGTRSAAEAPAVFAEEAQTEENAAVSEASLPAPPAEAVAAQEQAVGDSDIPMSLAGRSTLSGFEGSSSFVGRWELSADSAAQTDPEAYFAKLGLPLVQEGRAFHYGFTARSTAPGRGWVGVGFHAFLPATYTNKGYGGRGSLCVWLTRDPVHYKDNQTRIQLYRATDDWNMDLVAEAPVSESIYDANRFDFTVDPVSGIASVSLNGTERLSVRGLPELKKGIYVVLRSLDTAEFKDFTVELAK